MALQLVLPGEVATTSATRRSVGRILSQHPKASSMSNSNKFSKLALLPNVTAWFAYQNLLLHDAVTHVKAKIDQATVSRSPQQYPCLVSVDLKSAKIEANTLTLNPCFVYVKDASELMAEAQRQDITSDSDAFQLQSIPGNQTELEAIVNSTTSRAAERKRPTVSVREAEAAENDLVALLFALVVEMKEVGVLKKRNLLRALKTTAKWLDDTRKTNGDLPLAEVIAGLWEQNNAG